MNSIDIANISLPCDIQPPPPPSLPCSVNPDNARIAPENISLPCSLSPDKYNCAREKLTIKEIKPPGCVQSNNHSLLSKCTSSENRFLSSKWNQSDHSGIEYSFARRSSLAAPYAVESSTERRELKDKNVGEPTRSPNIPIKYKPMYTSENGGQHFEHWAPGSKVQSYQTKMGAASMELQGCSLGESQKSTVGPDKDNIAPENIYLPPSSFSPDKDKSTREKLSSQEKKPSGCIQVKHRLLSVSSSRTSTENRLLSSEWDQSDHHSKRRSSECSQSSTERRESKGWAAPYSVESSTERRESKGWAAHNLVESSTEFKEKTKFERQRSQSITIKSKQLYTMEDGRQFFAAWSPGFKVQSYENLKVMQGLTVDDDPVETASMELEGFSIGESQKSKESLPVLADLSWEDIVFPNLLPLLNPSDLFHLRAVDRQHYEMIQVFIVRNKRLDLSNSKKATKETFRILTQGAENLRYLNLTGAKWVTDDILRSVIKDNLLLEYLNLTSCQHLGAGILQTVTIKLKNIRSLILQDCHWVTKDAVQYHIFHQGREKKLKQVDFTGCWELGDDILVELLSRFSGIEVLRLGKIYSLTDKVMQAVASYCRGIRHLDVKGCWRISNAGIRLVGEYCKHLEFLEVSDCRDVTEHSLTRLRKKGIRVDRTLWAPVVPNNPELKNKI